MKEKNNHYIQRDPHMIRSNNQSGFTLIELIVVMVLSGILLGVMVMAFTGQSRSYNTQQDISTLQEDMWAALQLISRDVHMAGYDKKTTAGSKIIAATALTFNATQDINEDGALGGNEEDIKYSFVTPPAGSIASLMRSTNGGADQPVIDNLTHVGFDYRTITISGNDPWAWAWTAAPADLTTIRVVRVCMQGRTARQTSTVQDTSSFFPPLSNAPDWTPTAATVGAFQFRTMCVEIQCRNFID
jgi:type IV pilus assembly protein PilW